MAFDEPADLIGSCEASLDTLGLLVGDMGEEVQDRGGAWTIAQVLNHLLDTEQRYYSRVRRMREELKPKMRIMPDPDYTRLGALRAWSQFYELRQRHLKLLRSLQPAEWDREGSLSPIGDITIASLVRHLAAHDSMHTAQVARRLSGRPE
ncbi:MAG TPA: DinB family protein [Candidatus Micrarchaeaceae archaeon]|nr:DinB family protein [Candidatus Micrarchaeaceae archaeon]